ncbi:hypothetical protein F0L68_34660 [Solihabitans fulvus]|uniref:Uncharacterized protein n=1 Tax=Solihabitans fulvus TaxID=1892852 RepID=A0A5B2WNT4_9PSEU|nr:hypothetical protein [Solihabitans fulvus]KAA2252664.1 hypothetical protein F0L68_34660 [Solihabitans fulvus]
MINDRATWRIACRDVFGREQTLLIKFVGERRIVVATPPGEAAYLDAPALHALREVLSSPWLTGQVTS